MSRLRILLLAPDSNPDSVTTSLIGYCHGEALARHHSVTLVIRSANEASVRRRDAPFHAIETVRMPRLDRIATWGLRRLFKNDYGSQAFTAFNYPFCVAFEWRAWRQLRRRIMNGEFDVVLRLLPVTPVLPSPFAFLLKNTGIPFVIGPLNGGLPWPKGFSQADNQKEWLSNLRFLYRLLPFGRSTYTRAAAIVAGSSHTYGEFSRYGAKVFYVPENGISSAMCTDLPRTPDRDGKLQLIFVGRLVPYKACDLALRGAAALLQRGAAHFTVVGDGPERQRFAQLARSLGAESAVSFCGWLSHSETVQRLRAADVLVFPSVREFGGGVVFEALAVGAVPVVADFGGPGDVVNCDVGFRAALTTEADMVLQLETILEQLCRDRSLLERLRSSGISYARQHLTWDAKAIALTQILRWSVGHGPRPELRPPRGLELGGRPCQK